MRVLITITPSSFVTSFPSSHFLSFRAPLGDEKPKCRRPVQSQETMQFSPLEWPSPHGCLPPQLLHLPLQVEKLSFLAYFTMACLFLSFLLLSLLLIVLATPHLVRAFSPSLQIPVTPPPHFPSFKTAEFPSWVTEFPIFSSKQTPPNNTPTTKTNKKTQPKKPTKPPKTPPPPQKNHPHPQKTKKSDLPSFPPCLSMCQYRRPVLTTDNYPFFRRVLRLETFFCPFSTLLECATFVWLGHANDALSAKTSDPPWPKTEVSFTALSRIVSRPNFALMPRSSG